MGAFYDVAAAGQSFAESTEVFGEAFTYSNAALVGVFNQVELEYQFGDFSTRKETALVCVTSKAQWTSANVAPANRGVVTYGSIGYSIEKIDGSDTSAEPAFTLTLKRLT
jgi:hypothetical protein